MDWLTINISKDIKFICIAVKFWDYVVDGWWLDKTTWVPFQF